MEFQNKTKKIVNKTFIKSEIKNLKGIDASSAKSNNTRLDLQSQENPQKNTTTEEKKKEYQNQELYNVTDDNDNSLQSSIQNLKISIDPEDVVSKELLEYKNVDWSDLKLNFKTIKVLKSLGYNFPSPVQYESIPEILSGTDVLVRAKNGSGKSLSFLIPIIEKINVDDDSLQAIILAPTRELALQIGRFARSLCKDLNIKSTPLIGGSNVKDDIVRISSGVQLLVGSPGRMNAILSRNICKISKNPLIVFDEADKLLDAEFFEDIYKFIQLVPKKKQMCLFSATFPHTVKSFLNTNLVNPKLIKINEDHSLNNLTQFYCITTFHNRLPCLKSLLSCLNIEQCIIYVNSMNNCQMLARKITEMGLSCYFIHSSLTQDERNQIFHNFTKNKTQILVSTDITTRGTDVQGVNVVINFDMPISSECYLHRIGRAGRFGRKGCCINFIKEDQVTDINNYVLFAGSTVIPCFGEELKKFCKN
jgi:ATP-dependent RNA helicase DDX6/DHH1